MKTKLLPEGLHTKTIDYRIILLLSMLTLSMISGISLMLDKSYDYSNLLIEKNNYQDFFNLIYQNIIGKPYEGSTNVNPPLAHLFYWLVGLFVAEEMRFSPEAIRFAIGAPLILMLLQVMVVGILAIIIQQFIQKSRILRNVTLFSVLFSLPFVFAYNRNNIMFISYVGVLGFFLLKDRKKQSYHELSNLLLAIAQSLTIYTAWFNLILLKEKRYLDFAKVIGYTLVLNTVALLALGNPSSVLMSFIKNLANGVKNTAGAGLSPRIDIMMLMDYILRTLSSNSAKWISFLAFIAVIILAIFLVFSMKRQWQIVLTVVVAMVLTGVPSYFDSLIFISIPLLLFLNMENDFSPLSVWHSLLFILMLSPLPFMGNLAQYLGLTEYGIRTSVAMIALILVLVSSVIQSFIDHESINPTKSNLRQKK